MINMFERFLLPFFLVTAVATSVQAQSTDIKAMTEDGRKVVLAKDGRWRFDSTSLGQVSAPSSDSPYQTAIDSVSMRFDTKAWALSPAVAADGRTKRGFKHVTLPLHAMVIADEIPATTNQVRGVMLSNARAHTGSDPRVLSEEIKTVNGRAMGSMKFYIVVNGLEFVFSTLFYGGDIGNIQVMCWTGQAIFHKYEGDCQKFLDTLAIK